MKKRDQSQLISVAGFQFFNCIFYLIVVHVFQSLKMYNVEGEDDFIFSYHKNKPQSLVMLKSLKQLTKELNTKEKIYLIWMGDQQPSQPIKKHIKQNCPEQMISICNITKLEFFLAQAKIKRQVYLLITPPIFVKDVRQILSVQEHLNVFLCICYPSEGEDEQRIIKHVKTQKQLLEMISQFVTTLNKTNNLQWNFISINNQVDSIMLRNIMFAMLHQKVNVKQLSKHLKDLVKQMNSWWPEFKSKQAQQKEQKALNFFCQWINNKRKSKLDNDIFLWYTREGFIHKVINRMLRFCRNSYDIYYIQPIFGQLFYAIKYHYDKNKIKSKYNIDKKNFTCYRGMMASENQIKFLERNVGKIIQNLSFMSTSKQKVAAFLFLTNVLITIEVKDEQRDGSLDYGFAHIAYFSFYTNEEEVLFNPFNSFRIKQVKRDGQTFVCCLEYGPLAKILKTDNKDLKNPLEKQQKNIAIKQSLFSKAASTQGQSFFIFGTYQHGSLQYWKKYVSIAKKNKNKAKGYKSLSHIYNYLGLKQQALQCCFKWQKYAIMAYGHQSYMNAFALNGIGFMLKQCNNLSLAKTYFHQSLSILKQIKCEQSYYYFQAQFNLAQIYRLNQQREIAIENLLTCYSKKSEKISLTQDIHSQFYRILAKCILQVGSLETAQRIFQICYEIDRNLLNNKCPTLIPVLKTLANIYMTAEEYQKCFQKLSLCKEIIVVHYGIESSQSCEIYLAIADYYWQIKQESLAEEIYSEVYNLLHEILNKFSQKPFKTWEQSKTMQNKIKQFRLQMSQCLFKLACIYGSLQFEETHQFMNQFASKAVLLQASEIENHLTKKKQTGIKIPEPTYYCPFFLESKLNYYNQQMKAGRNIDSLYLQQLAIQLAFIKGKNTSKNYKKRQRVKQLISQVNYLSF